MSHRIEDFIVEAREHLGVVENSLLILEKQPASSEAQQHIDRCFRSIHSLKGDAGFLGFHRIRDLAHAMESVLGGPGGSLSQTMIETLLAVRDRLAVFVDDPDRSNSSDIADFLARLTAQNQDRSTIPIDVDLAGWNASNPGGLLPLFQKVAAAGIVQNGRLQLSASDLRDALPTGPVRWTGTVQTSRTIEHFRSLFGLKGNRPASRLERMTADLWAWSRQSGGLAARFRELKNDVQIVSGSLSIPEADLRLKLPEGPIRWSAECTTELSRENLVTRFGFELPKPAQSTSVERLSKGKTPKVETDSTPDAPAVGSNRPTPPAGAHAIESEKSTTLRIQVELLDRLMTLVGELTLVRNQALLAFADEDGAQRTIIQRLNSVTTELQDATLRARMQPIGNLFNKFPRMVRDLARQLGKQVEIELKGREVELDKTILEQLSDPLMHLIRNSVDHGIEMPDQRVANGKPPIGRIFLSATHEDGQVQIQIRDDGRGIDPQAVKTRALASGLKSEAELNRMSVRELFSLILLPGFSTAKQVTEVSGRGVGMDVVKTNIEQLEGVLHIDSAVGLGCSMMLRLPLTLAIIPCLIVTVNGDRFAVPQRELEEVVCLHPRAEGRIEQAFDTEVYRLRDKLLPIVRLSDVLHRKQPFTDRDKAEILAGRAVREAARCIEYILVLKLSGRRFGLVVDNVHETQEIVIKPMHPSMKKVGIFTGATIMGDGRVALITDSEGIVEHARLSFESAMEKVAIDRTVRDAAQAHRVLIFEYGLRQRFALPLLQIRRVEMISEDRIERVGDQEYVTVDGVSTRILRLNHLVDAAPPEQDAGSMPLILPKFVPQSMGILVSRIVDTESLAIDLQQQPDQDPCVLGSAIIRDRLTQFLDIHRLSEKFFGVSTEIQRRPSNRASSIKRLLLIDDTAFFREVIKRYLTAEGYEIVTAVHGEDGLRQLDTGLPFDLIVSDIEMPVMDGWQFAREVRRRGVKTPMLALTSLSGAHFEAKAKECGYDSYEVKLDHDRLVRRVGSMFADQSGSGEGGP